MNDTPMQRAIDACGGQTALAKAIGATQPFIWQVLKGRTRLTAERAVQIEAATNGVVTRYELRPDVFGPAPTDKAA